MNADQASLFVYYKVPLAEHALRLKQLVALRQSLLQQWPQMQLQTLQRPEASAEGLETWMEVYDHPGGLTQDHLDSITDLAAQAGLPAKRMVEIFVPLRP
jgi:hypothetical protein